VRIALTTKPLAYWSLTVLLAGATGWGVYGIVAAAAETKAGYGATTPVLVASRSIAPGAVLDATNTVLRHLPAAVVPAGVLDAPAPGAIARTELMAGEPVHRRRVGRAGESAIAAVLPDGTSGVPVPLTEAALPLQPGDRVDLIATVTAAPGGAAHVVTDDATVAYVGEAVAVVAVPTADVPAAAQALADGGVVLVLSAGR
jgi:Flp pilus assembly protein CpaB